MISQQTRICPSCKGKLKYYDSVQRIVRTKGRATKWIKIRRLKCEKCSHIHRELPKDMFPYKQYEMEMILGVIEGIITADTYGYEDYPCEMTMLRWTAQKTQLLLWKQNFKGGCLK